MVSNKPAVLVRNPSSLVIACTDIDLKKASKAFATHFSCGSSVTGDDEIVIQGDVCDEVADYIPEHWPDVR